MLDCSVCCGKERKLLGGRYFMLPKKRDSEINCGTQFSSRRFRVLEVGHLVRMFPFLISLCENIIRSELDRGKTKSGRKKNRFAWVPFTNRTYRVYALQIGQTFMRIRFVGFHISCLCVKKSLWRRNKKRHGIGPCIDSQRNTKNLRGITLNRRSLCYFYDLGNLVLTDPQGPWQITLERMFRQETIQRPQLFLGPGNVHFIKLVVYIYDSPGAS